MSSWAARYAPAVPVMAPSSVSRDTPENAQVAATEDASVEALRGPLCLFPRLRPQDEHSAYPSGNPINETHSSPGTTGLAAAFAVETSPGAGSSPPTPEFNFRKMGSSCTQLEVPLSLKDYCTGKWASSRCQNNGETRWGLEVQRKYDDFLERERKYITEGFLDQLPSRSRLFIGNLPTERITKRDLFHVFHKYGKLAQASIKQAYGFIQFLDSSACKKALGAEQGALVRGRKIHLEISNPRKRARHGPASAEAPCPTTRCYESYVKYDRSYRSCPLNRRKSIMPENCYDRAYESRHHVPSSDVKDEPTFCRQGNHQPPIWSLSPRVLRGRDEYQSWGKTPELYSKRGRGRSQSPYRKFRRDRSPIVRRHCLYECDKGPPVLRRALRDVPEVQILVLEDVDQNFVFHVESSFRNRGLRADTVVVGHRIPPDTAVQLQIIEGVLAVVRISQSNQLQRKIPLQLFDRSYGLVNDNPIEYPELEPSLAADIALHAQAVQRGVSPASNAPVTPFWVSSLPPRNPAPQPLYSALSNPSNVATMFASLAGSTLQSSLSALQQRPAPAIQQQQFRHANLTHAVAELASILNATRPSLTATISTLPLPSQPLPIEAPDIPAVPGQSPLSLLMKSFGEQHP